MVLPVRGSKDADLLHLVPEELDADARLLVGGDDLDHVAAHPEGPALQVVVVAVVAGLHELGQELAPVEGLPLAHEEQHPVVGLGRAQAVDAGDGGHDDHVAPLEEAAGGAEAHPVDLLVDGRFLLDVGVGLGDVGLGLVVVVIGDEVLDRVVGEERLELLVELGGQGLVVGEDEGGPVHAGEDGGDGEGLAAARDPEQDLVLVPAQEPGRQLVDRPRLVAARLEVAGQPEAAVRGGGGEPRLFRSGPHPVIIPCTPDASGPSAVDFAIFRPYPARELGTLLSEVLVCARAALSPASF